MNFEGVERKQKDLGGFAGRGAIGEGEVFAVHGPIERVHLAIGLHGIKSAFRASERCGDINGEILFFVIETEKRDVVAVRGPDRGKFEDALTGARNLTRGIGGANL